MFTKTLRRSVAPYSIFGALIISVDLNAQHSEAPHDIEEVVVTGALNQSKSETALPVHVLGGEDLHQEAAGTLGDTLRNLPGVHTTSYGVSVGQPVIRGQSGNRVSILHDNLAVTDASNISQDHANALEPLVAEKIEVLRGPATLLYGNGAIGGVVNVIDNRIPAHVDEEFSGALELRGNSVNRGQTAVIKLEGAKDAFAWHVDGLVRDADNTEIPGFAIDENYLEEVPEENSKGEIENSDLEADQLNVGVAWRFDRGFVGVSVSSLSNNYGIPPGAHEHEEEEGMEEEEEEHHEEFIRIDMEQTRLDLKGEFEFDGFFKRFKWQFADNDYEHKELEGEEVGTRFINDGRELRLALDHGESDKVGTWGVQWVDRDFSAIGEEAFIPAVNIEARGLFLVERLDFDALVWELGVRIDRQTIATGSQCNTSENSLSASSSLLWRQSAGKNLYVAISHSERAPTVEEVFSNVDLTTCSTQNDEDLLVEHAATARVELGNPNLNTEVSNNIELGLIKYGGDVKWEFNAFYNQFDDFIYLADTGILSDAETLVSAYLQDDATFYGLESKATWTLPGAVEAGHFDVSLVGDYVRAKRDGGEFLPRIPAARVGIELAWIQSAWSASLLSTVIMDQKRVAPGEFATNGYTRWDFYADYHWDVNDAEALLFAKLNNITDEEIRDHTSFLKAFAPAAGRDISLGLRFSF